MSAASGVLDASVLLAATLGEIAPDDAEYWLTGRCISAVNFSEAISKLLDKGFRPEIVTGNFAAMKLDIRPFGDEQAERAGLMRDASRHLGLSMGDRACLALAVELDCPAVTADRAWAKLDIGVQIELIR